MNQTRAVSSLLWVFLLLGSLFNIAELLPSTLAEEEREHDVRSWMIVLPQSQDAEPEVFPIGPLEEGETRQFFTSEGAEITVTRGDDGRVIKFNGKEITTAAHHGLVWVSKDEDEAHKIVRVGEHHEHPTEHVEVDADSQRHVTVHITKTDHRPQTLVNTISTSEAGPQIVIIDQLHVQKER